MIRRFGPLFAALIVLAVARPSAAEDAAPTVFDSSSTNIVSRLARSVVRVRRGDAWGSGFLFGSSRHVVTSYAVINVRGTLEVEDANGAQHDARVVAWSKTDDLALLELDHELSAPPLEAATEVPWVGAPIAALYYPEVTPSDRDDERAATGPTVQFGHVGRVVGTELDIDVGLPGRNGDDGAPVVAPSGRVMGVVVTIGEKTRTVAVTLARVDLLFALRGRQGDFTRRFPVLGFGGIFVTPVAAGDFLGAGITSGLRWDWLVFEFTDAFFQSDHHPVDGGRFEATKRFQLELDAEVQLGPKYFRVFFGPGVQLNFDNTEVSTPTSDGHLDTTTGQTVRARPAFKLGFGGPVLFAYGSISAEPRLDLGIVFGR